MIESDNSGLCAEFFQTKHSKNKWSFHCSLFFFVAFNQVCNNQHKVYLNADLLAPQFTMLLVFPPTQKVSFNKFSLQYFSTYFFQRKLCGKITRNMWLWTCNRSNAEIFQRWRFFFVLFFKKISFNLGNFYILINTLINK